MVFFETNVDTEAAVRTDLKGGNVKKIININLCIISSKDGLYIHDVAISQSYKKTRNHLLIIMSTKIHIHGRDALIHAYVLMRIDAQ